MKTVIPYSHQSIDELDVQSVAQTLQSEWLTQGPKVKEFEAALCASVGAKYAVVVSNGTAALHLSMLALEIGSQDQLITSPITFAASANCAVYVGAFPHFADINDKSSHICLHRLEEKLKVCIARGGKTVVVPVHFMGTVVDMEPLYDLCQSYGAYIVEDAAHALGASYYIEPDVWSNVGACSHSDMTIFSFHPIKHITTGEGGAVLTNNKQLYNRLIQLRHHGITRNNRPLSELLQQVQENQWFYDIPEVAHNFRITDFQCALGLSQLSKLDSMVNRRRHLVDSYNQAFANIKDIRTPFERAGTRGSYHLYVIRVPAHLRDNLYRFLLSRDIHSQVNYIPTHLFTYYQRTFGYRDGDYPHAEQFFRECLSLPLFPTFNESDQDYVIDSVREFFSA